jgi:hypothetical protein
MLTPLFSFFSEHSIRYLMKIVMKTPRDLDCLLIPYVLFHINDGVTELPLNRRDVAGFLYKVPAHGMPATWDPWPPRPASLQTSFQITLITLGLRRPSPWVLVAGERMQKFARPN